MDAEEHPELAEKYGIFQAPTLVAVADGIMQKFSGASNIRKFAEQNREAAYEDSDWRILYELYQTPNITKVAEKLFMTQPTLTKRLQYIEEEFQTRIVSRSTKGVVFTRKGNIWSIRRSCICSSGAGLTGGWRPLNRRGWERFGLLPPSPSVSSICLL